MAKTTSSSTPPAATAASNNTAEASAPVANAFALAPAPMHRPAPTLGETVMVRIVPGSLLVNNETGGFFIDGEDTPQTVTPTLLRRVADGDLVLL